MPVVQAVVPDKENSLVIRVFSRRLFFYLFGCAGSSWLHRHLSSCSEQGILSQCLRAVASLAAEHRLQSTGPQELQLPGCRAQIQQLCCTGLLAPWGPPGPGIKPVSPTLAGRFFTTVSPGEPQGFFNVFLNKIFIYLTLLGLSCGMQDLQSGHLGPSSLARDQTWARCIGRAGSQPLDHQGIPSQVGFKPGHALQDLSSSMSDPPGSLKL